jgi:hypothetical protein
MSQIKIMVLWDLMSCGQQTDTNILEEHGLYVTLVAKDREVCPSKMTTSDIIECDNHYDLNL